MQRVRMSGVCVLVLVLLLGACSADVPEGPTLDAGADEDADDGVEAAPDDAAPDDVAPDDAEPGDDEPTSAAGGGDAVATDDATGDTCPITPPAGWTEEPLDDPDDPASGHCRFVDPAATAVGMFNEVRWAAVDDADFRERPARAREFYEDTREEILGSDCGEGGVDHHVTFDEAVGDGELYGHAWYVARGPFVAGGQGCTNDLGASSYRIAIDGQVFQLRTLEGVAPCQLPADAGDAAAWEDYVACRVDEFERRNEQFRTLGAVMVGG